MGGSIETPLPKVKGSRYSSLLSALPQGGRCSPHVLLPLAQESDGGRKGSRPTFSSVPETIWVWCLVIKSEDLKNHVRARQNTCYGKSTKTIFIRQMEQADQFTL